MTNVLTENAEYILKKRYLLEDETPDEMFWRVANHVASCEEDATGWAGMFFDMMINLDFLPNSPTMMNAGTNQGSLSACFVIPVPDTMEGIMDASYAAAIVQKYGGGTGFSLSNLRRAGASINTTQGAACGPISVLRHLDDTSRLVTQGGKREGANMGILRYDHPDIMEFIACKADVEEHGLFKNFNISVGIEQAFFDCFNNPAVLSDYELVDPHTGPTGEWINAKRVWEAICEQAWKTGDPGLVFLDRINDSRANPVPSLGPIIATNPCGEQPLYDWDSCNLGSINLVNFYDKTFSTLLNPPGIYWERLKDTIHLAVRFLDNVIETNFYPLPQIEARNKEIRRIGLGVMGWADLLYLLKIKYDSEEALELAETLSTYIQYHADLASATLGKERGNYNKFTESVDNLQNGIDFMRNSTRTTIAPTGTISMIAGVSSGIEPNFALEFDRQHGENIGELKEFNPIYGQWLIDTKSSHSDAHPDYFVTAHDISPEWHVKMQAAWQKHTDNAVSKTINMPNSATVEDIGKAYQQAWDSGCMGVTVYRDGSRTGQVLSVNPDHKTELAAFEVDHLEDAKVYLGNESVYPRLDEAMKTVYVKKFGETLAEEQGRELDAKLAAFIPSLVHEESRATRKKLPDTGPATRHKFDIAGTKGYIHIGTYEDGCPGEVFITLTKEGSTIQGLMGTVAKLTSMLLQRGVTTEELLEDFAGTRFEPHGLTNHPDKNMKTVSSIVDYLFRYLYKVDPTNRKGIENLPDTMNFNRIESMTADASSIPVQGQLCPDCGRGLVHEEGCEKCYYCGYSSC